MPTLTRNQNVLATDREVALAGDVLTTLTGEEGYLAVGRSGDHATTPLPSEVGRILQHVLEALSRGQSVTVASVPSELTTTTAAGILGVARPTLMKMIADGELAAHKVGSHTRLKRDDVYAALRTRRDRERAALRDLLELEGDEL